VPNLGDFSAAAINAFAPYSITLVHFSGVFITFPH
jgi:hypothetical protein